MRGFFIMLGLLLAAMGGCESAVRTNVDPLGVAPMDFSIDMAVLTGRYVSDRTEVQLRQSRYVLYADGSLHSGAGNHRGEAWIPDMIRRLNRRQVADLWSFAQQIGFTDPAKGSEPMSQHLLEPDLDEIVYLIVFTGYDRSWGFVRRTRNLDAPDSASAQLVRKLAQYAWAMDFPDGRTAIVPPRYDFGPDPYAPYRE